MMKKQITIFLMLSFLVSGLVAQSSLKITNGAQVKIKGNPSLVLNNTSWENNGQFIADSSTVKFSGTITDSVKGSSTTTFWDVNLSKTTGNLVLAHGANVDDSVRFSSGLLDLNNQNLTLGTASGGLAGENETSRIIGASGGEVIKVQDLNAPSGVNPGNLGAVFTTASNMGTTTIRRGHQIQTLPGGNSIQRYYQIDPANNNGLNATVRMAYFDNELNGLNEATLESWHESGSNWVNISPNAKSTNPNYVEVIQDDLGKMTLGEGALKVSLKAFLQGSYAGGLMGDKLRENGLLPTTEPYTGLGFVQVGGGGETIDGSILAVTGNNAIVDWVFLELRDKNNPATLLRTQSVLIQRDGDIVGLDGSSFVTFAGMAADDYFLVIKHRNHLGVRTPGLITLVTIETNHDFTTGQNAVWQNPVISTNSALADLGGGVYGLFRGDVNSDNKINVVDFLLSKNNSTPNQSAVYNSGDINMDSNINVVDFLIGRAQSSPNKVGHN